MNEIIEIVNENIKDFKETFALPTSKKERKEFIKAFFGGCLMFGAGYVFFMMIYFLAPIGTWNGF